LLPFWARGQDTTVWKDAKNGKAETFIYVDKLPKANYDVNHYLSKHLRLPENISYDEYPEKVITSFVLEADGSISNPKIIKPTNTLLDSAIKTLLLSMPKWEPAEFGGKKVPSNYNLAVYIHLQ
jgi:hypothetical protein